MQNNIYQSLLQNLKQNCGVDAQTAVPEQVFEASVAYLRNLMLEKNEVFEKKAYGKKKVNYLCMEFLVGRSLKMHLSALGINDEFEIALNKLGFSIDDICDVERDLGIGNGGLGRLAACFMDSLAGLGYSATGYSLCYKFGLFKQKLIAGEQKELPDNWLDYDAELLLERKNKAVSVEFGGKIEEEWHEGKMHIRSHGGYKVTALPFDYFIPGYKNSVVLPLRLWKIIPSALPEAKISDVKEFEKMNVNDRFFSTITDYLYPDDSNYRGKCLRLCQQYFLVSASIQNILREHLEKYENLDNFAELNAVHINDTHPALTIPELMRLLMDVYGYEWNEAWHITVNSVSYTNHTVMPEAMECWNEEMFSKILPRIYAIISEINRRFTTSLWHDMPQDWNKIAKMAIISGGQIKMANLSVIGSHKINGVSEIHSQILREKVFAEYDALYPNKFCNVTNGIAHRRWLCNANPKLSKLITSAIGDGFVKNPCELSKLGDYTNDKVFLENFARQRMENKREFSSFAFERFSKQIDYESVFDVQIKRLHEYKRQLMNALRIISICIDIKNGKLKLVRPISFIFGAKAAPGYKMAKRIIKLLCCIGDYIERDPVLRKQVTVLFMDDYNVSLAERIIPCSDISEQISLAGKEASGTGNMKLMLNGALTLGTMDGANVEICSAVGAKNIFIFGMSENEVGRKKAQGYTPEEYLQDDKIKQVIDALKIGFCGESFNDIAIYLTQGAGNGPDPFMCLADFASYMDKSFYAYRKYEDTFEWYSSAVENVANAGLFSSDNSIKKYASDIWNVSPIR